MVKIGVIGAGKLAKMHIRCIQDIPEFVLVGFMEEDDEKAFEIEKEYGIRRFLQTEAFYDEVDALDIVVPAKMHLHAASRAIKAGKHVFIEKPLAHTLDEARELVELAYEGGVKIQVGHRERFNPALLHALKDDLRPLYIEVSNKRMFDPERNVDLLMDIMLQDIDIVLSLIRSNVKKIRAFGLSSDDSLPDMINARIEFDNGCVANLMASRVAEKEESIMQVFEKTDCITVNYLDQTSIRFPFKRSPENQGPVSGSIPPVRHEARSPAALNGVDSESERLLRYALSLFAKSIISNLPSAVNVHDGYNVLNIAFQIFEKIQSKANIR